MHRLRCAHTAFLAGGLRRLRRTLYTIAAPYLVRAPCYMAVLDTCHTFPARRADLPCRLYPHHHVVGRAAPGNPPRRARRYAASWRDLRVIEVVRDASGDARAFGGRGWALICGTAPQDTQPQVVLPMLIEQTFDTAMYVTH